MDNLRIFNAISLGVMNIHQIFNYLGKDREADKTDFIAGDVRHRKQERGRHQGEGSE